MEHTKHHEVWEAGGLDASLESLVQEYACSVGNTCGGIPAELFQGAMRIAAENAKIHAAGPADCTANANGTDGTGDNMEESINPAEDCVGIIDGGVDDISPVEIWDTIMKKYKVS